MTEAGLLNELCDNGLITRTFMRLDADKREQVLDGILQEMASAGSHEASLKGSARRSGIPVGSFYQYFPDRDGMICAASRITALRLTCELASYREELTALPLRDGLHAYIRGALEWAAAKPVLLRVFASAIYRDSIPAGDSPLPDGDDLVSPVSEAFLSLVTALFSAADFRGELKPGVSTDTAARLANGLIITLCDSLLFPGLDRYYRYRTAGLGEDGLIASAVDFIVSAVSA